MRMVFTHDEICAILRTHVFEKLHIESSTIGAVVFTDNEGDEVKPIAADVEMKTERGIPKIIAGPYRTSG